MSAALDMFPETLPDEGESNDERYTPRSLFQPLHKEFDFTLDLCATRESAKCPRYFTKEQDGLKQSWRGERCFGNVPFSDIRPWIVKAWDEAFDSLIVLLVAAWTDRRWWHELVEPFRDKPTSALRTRFLPRVKFGRPGNPEGVGVGQPEFWCCLLIWGST